MSYGSFATSINCIDGRVHLPVIAWLRAQYDIEYVDMVTEHGPDAILSRGDDMLSYASIKNRVGLSVKNHDSKLVVVSAHYNCEVNNGDREKIFHQVHLAVRNVESWNLGVDVIGLWVDENWHVHVL
jgi:hypothetical protein